MLDTPGYGEGFDLRDTLDLLVTTIEDRFKSDEEPVRVIFYLIAPHRIKPVDEEFIEALSQLATVVPIVAKADTMTILEKDHFMVIVNEKLHACNEGLLFFFVLLIRFIFESYNPTSFHT
jgi:septin family protein